MLHVLIQIKKCRKNSSNVINLQKSDEIRYLVVQNHNKTAVRGSMSEANKW